MFGVIVATLVGVLFLLPFPSWAKLVNIVTSASVFMYAGAPVALGALRKQKPELPRTLPTAGRASARRRWRSPAPAGSSCSPGWQNVSTLIVALLLGYLLIWISYATKANPKAPSMDWQAAPWIITWIIGMALIDYFSDFGAGGIIGGIGFFKNVLAKGGNDDLGLCGLHHRLRCVQLDHLLPGRWRAVYRRRRWTSTCETFILRRSLSSRRLRARRREATRPARPRWPAGLLASGAGWASRPPWAAASR